MEATPGQLVWEGLKAGMVIWPYGLLCCLAWQPFCRRKTTDLAGLAMFGPFKELILGVGFGLSMFAGATVVGVEAIWLMQLAGIQVTETILVGGIAAGVVLGGAGWKAMRFLVAQAIQHNRSFSRDFH